MAKGKEVVNKETTEAILEQMNKFNPSSEATKVEAMRAVAQVQGALTIAQHNRRDKIRAVGDMREACSNMFLAERAFFRFNRGGQVSGPSIHLAVELARCWGNIEYGIQELSRAANQSEMQAYAWDLETNTKPSISFIVPHKRDKRDGPVDLESMRDIYENNANLGARRVREMIFRVLPASFIEEAKVLCERTLAEGGGDDIQTRRESLLEAFSELGVTRKMVEPALSTTVSSAGRRRSRQSLAIRTKWPTVWTGL
jgi:hypothetical protein